VVAKGWTNDPTMALKLERLNYPYNIAKKMIRRFLCSSMKKNRFASRVVHLPQNSLREKLEILQRSKDIDDIRIGCALLRGGLVPVIDGKIQFQHIIYDIQQVYNHPDLALLCSFHPRAGMVAYAEERVIDSTRYNTLKYYLSELNINSDDLMVGTGKFVGTPPSRIFHSFVAPRANKISQINNDQNSINIAAKRTANQINRALCQERADQADYLRNVDNSKQQQLDNSADTNTDSNSNANASTDSNTVEPKKILHPVVLVLDNIRSAHNVGSLFRSCDTAGVSKLFTCGITPHPPNSPKLRKTALEALNYVNTYHYDDTIECIKQLKNDGYYIIVMETTNKSILYSNNNIYPKSDKKTAIIVGNEITGVDTNVIDIADLIIEIPTYGTKNSLNVACAAPIVLYEYIRQLQLQEKEEGEGEGEGEEEEDTNI
jgi:23S rRNA (guanosine2251-2'-O)-methyltransferase